MKKLFSVVLLLALLVSCFAGCGEAAPAGTTVYGEDAATILAQRRDTAVRYMR